MLRETKHLLSLMCCKCKDNNYILYLINILINIYLIKEILAFVGRLYKENHRHKEQESCDKTEQSVTWSCDQLVVERQTKRFVNRKAEMTFQGWKDRFFSAEAGLLFLRLKGHPNHLSTTALPNRQGLSMVAR